jgi:predicted transcriptional regulator
MASTPKPLSVLENEVMQIVWTGRAQTAEDIQTTLVKKRKLKDSTIRTILRRLESKGYVRHRVDGRTFVYEPTMPRDRVAARALRQIIDQLCTGSLEMLLVGMVNERVCSGEQLQRLAKKIAQQAEDK